MLRQISGLALVCGGECFCVCVPNKRGRSANDLNGIIGWVNDTSSCIDDCDKRGLSFRSCAELRDIFYRSNEMESGAGCGGDVGGVIGLDWGFKKAFQMQGMICSGVIGSWSHR